MIRLRVKEVAQEKGVSQGKLSRMANVDPKTIKNIYHDPLVDIRLSTLARIAQALGVPSCDLIEDIPDQ
jgi:DNA-binding Xre family transcriptional regulator